MITCLRTLYNNPERFPYVIDTMKEAEPENYFRRDERRFMIAHKYGFNNEEYHSYVADSGIVYTTEPFLLVVFTDNTPQAYDVLAQYAVLMCDYTEYHTTERIRQGAPERAMQKLSFPEAPVPEKGEETAVGGVTDAPLLDMDLTTFARLAGVLALTAIGLGLCVKLAKHAGYVTLVPAVIILLAGVLISRGLILSSGAGLFNADRGDGSAAVESFFGSLESGDYAAACELLNGYSALGVEAEPEDPNAARVVEALRRSYAHTRVGGSSEENEASHSVSFRHLDIAAMRDAVFAQTRSVLDSFVAARPESEVFDGAGEIREELLEEAFAQALDAALAQPEDYAREDALELKLQYSLKGWLIQPDEALMNAICGR